MFTILLSIPRSSRHSNPNEISWESVHSHFNDLFSEDFICVMKPFNGDHTQAKIYFKRKVTFANRSDDFLINNAVPAKVIGKKEDPSLPPTSSRTVQLPRSCTESQLLEIKIDLEDRYRIEMQLVASASVGSSEVTLHACHPEILDCAETALRKWATTTVSASEGSRASSTSGVSGRRSKRPLFPSALADHDADQSSGAVAMAEDGRYLRELGPYDFDLALNDRCRLRVQPHDITALQCDLLVVTTSCSLSLNFGLARVVAAKSGMQYLTQHCRQRIAQSGNLTFGQTHLVPTPPGSQLPARHLLFLALPNDQRLTASLDTVQFKAVMRDVVVSLLDLIVGLSADSAANGGVGCQVRSVAMTTLGASLPYWGDRSEDFAHVLAGAFWDARTRTGDLRCINVCDLQIENLATLGRVLEARFGVSLAQATFGRQPLPAGRRGFEPTAAVGGGSDVAGVDGDCDICCAALTAGNPRTGFHCNRGSLCADCVRRLQDPVAPGNGKCPICLARYRPAIGNQPAGGTMTVKAEAMSLPGHEGRYTLVVTYTFGSGVQDPSHPNPGLPYRGASRVTYFPDSAEGRAVVKRLKAAFESRAVFTVGTSSTTGMDNTVTWATVHHKTSTSGGPERHGYPDPTYLTRISDELLALGY